MKNRTSSRKFKKLTIGIGMLVMEQLKSEEPEKFKEIKTDRTRTLLETKLNHKFKSFSDNEETLKWCALLNLRKALGKNPNLNEWDCANILFDTLFDERVFKYLDFFKRWDVIPTWAGLIYIIIEMTGKC